MTRKQAFQRKVLSRNEQSDKEGCTRLRWMSDGCNADTMMANGKGEVTRCGHSKQPRTKESWNRSVILRHDRDAWNVHNIWE